jgi:hypothetical protein
MSQVYTLAGLALDRSFGYQDALEGSRHVAASFLPVDALDGSFGAGRLAVVHKAPPRKIVRRRP